MSLVELIVESAKVPSFSTYEERLHPFIDEYLGQFKHIKINKIKDNNILVEVEGKRGGKPVVITSHLDKINHFGVQFPEALQVEVEGEQICGQMDNSVGVGMCLNLINIAKERHFPPLLVLFSEMEESTGLRHHPHLLKNEGKDVAPQIGARRLSQYIDLHNLSPAMFITIDTTPVFKGASGVALYTEYWEKMNAEPDAELLQKIERIKKYVLSVAPSVQLSNGTNDYMIYGKHFSQQEKGNVPSIALEPAIFPYHQIGEKVFIRDVQLVQEIIIKMLENFNYKYD